MRLFFRTSDKSPSAWSVALVVAAGMAILETVVGAVLYRDLPVNRIRFFLLFAAAYAVLASMFGGTLAALAGRIWRRPLPAISVGVGVAWLALLYLRSLQVVKLAATPGVRSGPATVLMVVAVAGAVALGLAAFFIGKTRLARIRGVPVVNGLLALVAVGMFLWRPTLPSAVVQEADRGTNRSPFVSPLPAQATNVLLIVIDTLRADHTNPHGYLRNTTPVLEVLADEGVLFERCITQRTLTAPSMATVMTGLYPPTHGVVNNMTIFPDFNLTLAEILAQNEYVTGAISCSATLTPETKFDQGFQYFENVTTETLQDRENESLLANRVALDWLTEHHSEQFFMWVHYMDPHSPYIVPSELKNLFTGDELADRNGHRQLPLGPDYKGGLEQNIIIDDSRDQDFYIAQYDAEIWFNDRSLGELLAAVRDFGVLDDTLIIVTADHGESLGEHNFMFNHGRYCYEPTAHVPLIISHPSLLSGTRISAPVGLVDLLPTICDLLSIRIDQPVHGQSLASCLVTAEPPSVRPFNFTQSAWRLGYQTHSVTTDRHKVVFYSDIQWIYIDVVFETLARAWLGDRFPNKYRLRRIRREVFDLRADPAEAVDLSGQAPPFQAGLEAELWEWMDWVHGSGGGLSAQDADITPEQIKQLRALGYVH